MQKKSMRKVLSVLLTLAMLLSMPLTALATEVEVAEETLPVVEEAAAPEMIEIEEVEEVLVEEVFVEETPVVEEAPAAAKSAPKAVLAAAEEEEVVELYADPVAMIGEDGYETLNAAITAALPLLAESDVTIDLVADATLTEAVEINHGANKLTIQIADGVTGPVTVTSSSEARFNVSSESVVVITGKSAAENIVFDGTDATFTTVTPFLFQGSSNVTLDYVTVQNYVEGCEKAAPMVMYTTTVTITNSNFVENTGSSAGALRCADYTSKLYVSGSTFKGNTGTSNAGAIFVYGANADVDIYNSTFTGNTTTNAGAGAVYAYADSGLYLEGCTFEENGGSYGNAMRIREGTVTMKGCSFKNNSGSSRGTVYCGNGGNANSYTVGNAVLENCSFSGNSSTNSSSGGDIMLWRKGSVTIKGTLTMEPTGESTPSIFSNIYMAYTTCSVVFEGATAEVDTIHIPDIETYSAVAVTIADPAEYGATTLTVNTPSEPLRYAVDGFGVDVNYNYNVTLNDEDVETTDGIFTTGEGTEELLIEAWATKKATSYVASVDGTGYTTLDAALEAVGTPDEETDIYLIADIDVAEEKVYTIPATVRFVVEGEASITGAGVTFDGQDAVRANQMFRVTSTGSLTLENVTITNSHTNGKSGAAIIAYGTLTMTDCTLTNGTVEGTKSGGAFYTEGATVTATNCTFSNNSATNYGGAIYFYNSTVTLTNCTVSGNENTGTGGGIYWTGTTTGTISGGSITNNVTGKYGGAIYTGSSSSITLTGGVTITGNKATNANGHGIYVCGSSVISGVTIKDNLTESENKNQETSIYNNATLTICGENDIAKLFISGSNVSSVTLGGAVTGTVGVYVNDYTKYAATGTLPLLVEGSSASGALASSYQNFVMLDEDYELLDTGYVALKGVAKIGNTYYSTYAAASTAAASGETVALVTDIDETTIIVKVGVTLDLNGKTATAMNVAAFADAAIIDTSEDNSGKLVCAKNALAFLSEIPALPLWVDEGDGAGYYFFVTPEYKTQTSESGSVYTYLFLPRLGEKAEALLAANGAEALGAKLKIRLANDTGATVDSWENLRFGEDAIMSVYGDKLAFAVRLTGYEDFANLTIQVLFENVDGYTSSGWRSLSAPTSVQ